MPEDDVSDLKDVFDAINKLCETMKTSNCDDSSPRSDALERGDGGDGTVVGPGEVPARTVEFYDRNARSPENDERSEADGAVRSQFVSAEDLSTQRMETQRQKWRESQASLANSEASVYRDAAAEERWSDTQASPPSTREGGRASSPGLAGGGELYYTASSDVSLASEPEGVPAGHVAAMRERFESMTRANTPVPDAPRDVTPETDLLH